MLADKEGFSSTNKLVVESIFKELAKLGNLNVMEGISVVYNNPMDPTFVVLMNKLFQFLKKKKKNWCGGGI